MKRKRVTMEPELEKIAGHFTSYERFALARKLIRWAQQLEISAKILSKPHSPDPKKIRWVQTEFLKWN